MGHGTALGALNGIAVSMLFGIIERDVRLAMFGIIVGVIIGMIVGVVSGALARASAKAPFVVRYPLIVILPALTIVSVSAVTFRPSWQMALFSVPTVLLCLLLEKWTRAPRKEEPVPIARVA